MKKLGFGCMRLPLKDSEDASSIDYEQTCKMFDYFLDNGYTYFDTAYFYHKYSSEVAVRECLVKRHPRDSFTITTKLFLHNLESIDDAENMYNKQLENLGVDYFDYYWLHAVEEKKMETVNKLNLFSFIKEKKEQGKTKHIGFSYHGSAKLLDEILSKHPEVEYVQLQINYLDWNSPSVQSKMCYEVCVKYNKPVIVMEPVKGGALVNIPLEAKENFVKYDSTRSMANWALRFVNDLDGVMMILSGMSNIEQVIDNCKTFDSIKKLNEEEKRIIENNILIIQKSKRIPCTACRYCVEGCPINIAIPEYFDLANKEKADVFRYALLVKEGHSKASECIKCGVCESLCPQNLTIRDYLENIVVKEFENDN